MVLQQKIGILGGGQLGQMFIQNAISYGVHISVLDPSENCSCAKIASHFEQGSFKDFETVLTFGRKVDVLTIEIEHVNTEALFQLESEGIKVIPSASTIHIIKDKGLQKEFYDEHHIPSAEFVCIDNKNEIDKYAHWLPVFQKARKDGYDGKGVVSLKNKNDFKNAFDCPSILESRVDVDKELSVIVAKSQNGEMKVFPVVELVFDPVYNLVDYLKIPAKISQEQNDKTIQIAKKVVKSLKSAGLFAVELFLTKDGEILVNETAPRAHNSGHHTIEASISSQFDQQLRILLGLPLGETKSYPAAAMINVVGSENNQGKANYEGVETILAEENVYLHLYGKEETRPGRKMGHVSIIGKNEEEITTKITLVKEHLKVNAK